LGSITYIGKLEYKPAAPDIKCSTQIEEITLHHDRLTNVHGTVSMNKKLVGKQEKNKEKKLEFKNY
jgi:hypothetical protein